jgi:hypothetical protein
MSQGKMEGVCRQKLVDKGKEIGKLISRIASIKLVLLEGSVVLGYADNISDIDIVALGDTLPKIREIEILFESIAKDVKIEHSNYAWIQVRIYYEGAEASIGFGKYCDFKENIKQMENSAKNYLVYIYNKHILNWIINTMVLYDKENIMKIRTKIRITEYIKKKLIPRLYKDVEKYVIGEKCKLKKEAGRKNILYLHYLD